MITLRILGKYALFTEPILKTGGEKFTYLIPTYEAIKGVLKSVYWKPTFIWVPDKIRILKTMRTEAKAVKPRKYGEAGNDLAIYTYLTDVEYQVQAHFVWNLFRPELAGDRNMGKHLDSALRHLKKGGRQDIFLGTRECQGYVEPCEFGASAGEYDKSGVIEFSTMYHSISYPDENGTGKDGVGKMYYCFWEPKMQDGVIEFKPQEECQRRYIRDDTVKLFDKRNLKSVDEEVS